MSRLQATAVTPQLLHAKAEGDQRTRCEPIKKRAERRGRQPLGQR